MNDFNLYECADFFMARTALLPFQSYTAMTDAAECKKALWAFYQKTPLFQEAIAIASPLLHQTLKNTQPDKNFDKVYFSILKYFLRMSSRTTPFGLFSCVGWGEFAEKTNLQIDLKCIQKNVKPDMAWVQKIIDFLRSQSASIQQSCVVANVNIQKKSNRVFLTQMGEDKIPKKISILRTPALESLLELAKSPIHYLELIDQLNLLFPSHERERIAGFVDQIIQKGFLISEISLCIDRPFRLSHLISKIPSVENQPLVETLEKIDGLLKKYEAAPLYSDRPDSLCALEEALIALNAWQEVDYPVHVDSFIKKDGLQLHRKIQKEVSEAATALWLLSQHNTKATVLRDYHLKFLDKYGIHRLIPFKDLLHDTRGLGFPVVQEQKKEKTKNPLHDLFFSMNYEKEMVVDKMIEKLWTEAEEKKKEAPFSLEIYFDLFAASSEAIDQNDYTLAINPVNATVQAGNTFGRFLSLWGEQNTKVEAIRQFLVKEEPLYEHALFVEASFLPESPRTANVCFFERVRSFQLSMHYQDSSEQQIDLEDLYVGATGQRLYVYSKKFNKELHVTLSSAVNPDFSPPLLKFILDICQQRFTLFSPFLWDETMESACYLPRIKYQRTILCPARWCLTYDQLQLPSHADEKSVKKALVHFFQTKEVPDLVYLTDFDHRLLITTTHPDHRQLLCQHLMSKKRLVLFEYLGNKQHPMHSEEGSHVAEFVVPLVKNQLYPLPKDLGTYAPTPLYSVKDRLSLACKSWLYTKLFVPKDHIEDFILSDLSPFIHSLAQTGLIKKWFYIRYSEGSSHVRVRLHSASEDVYFQLMEKLSEWTASMISDEKIADFSYHPYERELERYGGIASIEEAEDLFCADSACCFRLLEIFKHPKNTLPLTALAAFQIVHYLKYFYGSMEEIVQFLSPMSTEKALLSGFRSHTKLSLKYIHALFFDEKNEWGEEEFLLAHVHHTCAMTTISVQNYLRKIDELEHIHALENTKTEIIDSILHMHCNRLLGFDLNLEMEARVIAFHLMNKIRFKERIS